MAAGRRIISLTSYTWIKKTLLTTHPLHLRFKIQEEGLHGSTWGTDTVINNKGNQVIHIPECIEDGQYLLRAEMIALHGARSVNGAQLYVRSLCYCLST